MTDRFRAWASTAPHLKAWGTVFLAAIAMIWSGVTWTDDKLRKIEHANNEIPAIKRDLTVVKESVSQIKEWQRLADQRDALRAEESAKRAEEQARQSAEIMAGINRLLAEHPPGAGVGNKRTGRP